ncbi:PP2C family protein-serine/threonine phosphatase [Microlunatus elymi]|uniref:PP2C family protein-serine/threonine phosphatase n=1 Tax=Microlunatus elymi TaxID=2596828 RepID=UPI00143D4D8C|nr:PP2C family serine/threonine-protein phosphatase [Microlunatus elymi]
MHLLEYGAVTDRGTVRSVNEDSILASPPVFVVADGVGGNADGELASAIVVEEFGKLARRPVIDADAVSATIQAAHLRVRGLNVADEPHGPSSTAVGAVGLLAGEEPYWLVFNIGDSRIYRLPAHPSEGADERELSQISVDHSHVQELVDAGVITADQAAGHPDRNLVTRAIGAEADCEPDFWMIPMVPGDRLLICSDGLLAAPYADLLGRLLQPSEAAAAADDLLQLALAAGATDNVSIIVVDVAAVAAGEPESDEVTSVQPHPHAPVPDSV